MKNNKLVLLDKDYSTKKMTIALILLVLVYTYAGHILMVDEFVPEPWNAIIYFIIVFVVAIFCVKFSETTRVFQRRLKLKKASLVMTIITLVVFALMFLMTKITGWLEVLQLPSEDIITSLFIALGAGVGEEFLLRNLAFNTCLTYFKNSRYNIFWSSVISSAIFGLLHLINLLHQDWNTTSEQVFYAFSAGLVLMLIHIVTNNMKLTPVLHFLYDLTPFIASTQAGFLPWVIILSVFGPILVLSLISLWLINRRYLKVNEE